MKIQVAIGYRCCRLDDSITPQQVQEILERAREQVKLKAAGFGYTIPADAEPVELIFDINHSVIAITFEATKIPV